MPSRSKGARVIQLFPVRNSEGEARYAAWPEAALIVEGVRRLMASKPGKLLLCGCGFAAIFFVLSDREPPL
jgi:hypothetical protein